MINRFLPIPFVLCLAFFVNGCSVSVIQQLISLHKEKLANSEFELSRDYLMAAMRLSPESAEVFDYAIQYVEETQKHEDEDINLLGDLVMGNLESLIPFQPAHKIADARKRLNGLLPPTDATATPNTNIAEEIDSTTLTEFETWWKDKGEKWCNEAEKALKGDTNAEERLRQIGAINIRPVGASSQEYRKTCHNIGIEIQKQINNGGIVAREFSLFYLELPDNEKIQECQEKIEKITNSLFQAKEWVYNCEALETLRCGEAEKSMDAKTILLEYLCPIEEHRLDPWIKEQYDTLWTKLFNQIKTDDDKVSIIKQKWLKIPKDQ